jgi:hypothetical protein
MESKENDAGKFGKRDDKRQAGIETRNQGWRTRYWLTVLFPSSREMLLALRVSRTLSIRRQSRSSARTVFAFLRPSIVGRTDEHCFSVCACPCPWLSSSSTPYYPRRQRTHRRRGQARCRSSNEAARG